MSDACDETPRAVTLQCRIYLQYNATGLIRQAPTPWHGWLAPAMQAPAWRVTDLGSATPSRRHWRQRMPYLNEDKPKNCFRCEHLSASDAGYVCGLGFGE